VSLESLLWQREFTISRQRACGGEWGRVERRQRKDLKENSKRMQVCIGEVLAESPGAISFCQSSVTFLFVIATKHIIHPILLLKVPFGSHD
jgi:hypothetical protein